MRKSYLLIALILLLVGVVSSAGVWKIPSSTAEAHMMLPVAGGGATGGGGGGDYSDNFDDNDITDWSQESGTWIASGGVLQPPDSAAGIIIAPDSTTGNDQYAAMKQAGNATTNSYDGIAFNVNASGVGYAVRWQRAGGTFLFRKLTAWTTGNGDIGSTVSDGALTVGDSWGVRSSTISTVKVVRLYLWDSQSPPAWGTWADGACVKAWCNGTCPAGVVCDSEEDVSGDSDWALLTGTDVGVYSGSTAASYWDDFTYGDDD